MSKTVLFQTIQFSISTQFSCIRPIDRTPSGVSTPGQSEPGSNGNEGVLRIPPKLQHYLNLTIRLFSVISMTLVARWGFYPPAEMQSVYSTAPSNWPSIYIYIVRILIIHRCMYVCNCNPGKKAHHSKIFTGAIHLIWSLRINQFTVQFATEW